MRSAANRFAPFLAAALALGMAPFAVAGEGAPAGPEGDYPRVLGDPFVIDGVTYTPVDTMNYDQVGYAAMRGEGAGIGGSHRTLPLPSYVEVTSLDSGRTILVRLDQRGPMSGPDLIDLSPAAWSQLGLSPGVTVAVRVRRVNPPEPERALLRLGEQAPERMETPKGLLAVLVRKLPPAPPGALKPGIAPAPVATSPTLAGAALPPEATPAAKPLPKPLPPVAAHSAAAARAAVPAAAPAPEAKPVLPPTIRPATAPPAQVASSGGFFVQAAVFSTKARADAAAATLGGVVTPTGKLWRVRVGPLASTDAAQAALAKVKAAGYADARVVRAP